MKPEANKSMVFLVQDDCYPEHEHDALVSKALGLDSPNYLCAARIPTEEMESDDPGMIVSYFLMKSACPFWHKRGMRMIQHMDVVTVGKKAYLILDKYLATKYGLKIIPIPGHDNFVVGGPIIALES